MSHFTTAQNDFTLQPCWFYIIFHLTYHHLIVAEFRDFSMGWQSSWKKNTNPYDGKKPFEKRLVWDRAPHYEISLEEKGE